jgi:LysR family glycine cleavage system transcriptional activator
LNALRAFEAAGRLLSFKLAANELNVTPGAVSRQIKTLEEFLKVPLFERDTRQVRLTHVGIEYLLAARHALDQVDLVTTRILSRNVGDLLAVRVLPTLAIRWLIPELVSFQERHQNVVVSITTSVEPPDFQRELIDVAITRHVGDARKMHVETIAPERLVLVGSPQLLDKRPLKSPRDLRHFKCLTAVTRPDIWSTWCAAMGLKQVPSGMQAFEQLNMALQGAVAGLGLTVAPHLMVAADIAAGHLQCPLGETVRSPHSYHLVYPPAKGELRAVRSFRSWLLDATKKTVAVFPN